VCVFDISYLVSSLGCLWFETSSVQTCDENAAVVYAGSCN
jgi:hypothetical protein